MKTFTRSRAFFPASLAVFIVICVLYGLKRFTLGVDFTDEGAYLSWPMRMLFGEKLFESESLTLLRPLEALLFMVFKLHPAMTLYEFRLAGWTLHLGSFAILSLYLFRLSGAVWQSLLIASLPLFVCNIFGLASPSYNSLSSDFLLLSLSLRGLALLDQSTGKTALNAGSGLALFLATLAHPGLGLVAALLIVHELIAHGLARNLWQRRLTASNVGVLVFIACWIVFFLYLAESGALARWIERTALFKSFTVTAKEARPGSVYYEIALYPFSYSRVALSTTLGTLATAAAAFWFSRTGRCQVAERAGVAMAGLLIVAFVYSVGYDADSLSTCLAMISLLMIGVHLSGLVQPVRPSPAGVRFLLLVSAVAAGCYAALSFYFFPHRSWISGILGLPFAFSVGLTLLLQSRTVAPRSLRLIFTCALLLGGAGAAAEHYRNIYRDAPPVGLQAGFHVPKLRGIKSTEERVQAIDALYDHLQPKLARGEPLLAFDDCPMLYYLLDAKPVYGLTWAVRYTQRPASLELLNRELISRPLPRYAIRTLVDISNPVWSTAPRTRYDHYPLNETVTTRYELERTIFPFEIWRLKPAGP